MLVSSNPAARNVGPLFLCVGIVGQWVTDPLILPQLFLMPSPVHLTEVPSNKLQKQDPPH